MRLNTLTVGLVLFAISHTFAMEMPDRIKCAGSYGGHLQGTDARGTNIWWSFTKQIVRTDLTGYVHASCDAPSHQGDLCVKGDTLYVAVNLGRFNTETGGVSFVYSFDAVTLKQKKVWPINMPMGAGGMTWKDDRFYVVGGLPPTHRCNYVYEYDTDFNLVKRHTLESGYTVLGIQTAAFIDGEFLFGIYGGKGNPGGVLRCSTDFKKIRRYDEAGSVGFAKIGGRIYTGSTVAATGKKKSWTGSLKLAEDFLGEKKLFSNSWYKKGVFTDAPVNAAIVRIGTAKGGVNFKFGNSWRKKMKKLVAEGYNAFFMDIADGVEYPKHPELAAKGAWSWAELDKALKIARAEGLEPIAYMDFTSPRNSWLGEKNLSGASKESLSLCCELVADTVKAFGNARYFKLETKGLSEETVKALNDAILSNGYGSCPWAMRCSGSTSPHR